MEASRGLEYFLHSLLELCHYHMGKTWPNIVHHKKDVPVSSSSSAISHQISEWDPSKSSEPLMGDAWLDHLRSATHLTRVLMNSVSALSQVTTFWGWFVTQNRSGMTEVTSPGEGDSIHLQTCIIKGGFSPTERHSLRKLMLESPRGRADWKWQSYFAA